jgi:hypothetical protein
VDLDVVSSFGQIERETTITPGGGASNDAILGGQTYLDGGTPYGRVRSRDDSLELPNRAFFNRHRQQSGAAAHRCMDEQNVPESEREQVHAAHEPAMKDGARERRQRHDVAYERSA